MGYRTSYWFKDDVLMATEYDEWREPYTTDWGGTRYREESRTICERRADRREAANMLDKCLREIADYEHRTKENTADVEYNIGLSLGKRKSLMAENARYEKDLVELRHKVEVLEKLLGDPRR